MNIAEIKDLDQVKAFLEGSQKIAFKVLGTQRERYGWVESILTRFFYGRLKKKDKGLIVAYLQKITGYSRQQVTRLIHKHRKTGYVKRQQRSTSGFKKKYTHEDALLLAKTDELHETLSGAATKKLCERAFHVFGQEEYQQLAKISVSHLYNLRNSNSYRQKRWNYEKTKPKLSTIGQRRKPNAGGIPGHIRIDTVHQGDRDGQKGVYHVNAVDEITQFEVIYTVSQISEQSLIPALAEMLDTFPFVIKGFHSDNGSEYVNKQVAKLLEKLLIEFTKSRPRHSNDNALAESKNGAIIRKVLGYSHIPQSFASQVNDFNQKFLNPYINYHRPCYFAKITVDAKGKERRKYYYDDIATPYDKLKSLPNAEMHLKAGLSFATLDQIAHVVSDSEAARQLLAARSKLFDIIDSEERLAA